MIKAISVLRQLEKNETRLSKAQHMARLGHCEWYFVDGIKIYLSDEVFIIFQRDKEIFVSDEAGFLSLMYAEDKACLQKSFDEIIKNKTVVTIEHRIITGKGEQRFVEQQIEMIENLNHQLIGLTVIIQDITERKEHENKIKRLTYYDEIKL